MAARNNITGRGTNWSSLRTTGYNDTIDVSEYTEDLRGFIQRYLGGNAVEGGQSMTQTTNTAGAENPTFLGVDLAVNDSTSGVVLISAVGGGGGSSESSNSWELGRIEPRRVALSDAGVLNPWPRMPDVRDYDEYYRALSGYHTKVKPKDEKIPILDYNAVDIRQIAHKARTLLGSIKILIYEAACRGANSIEIGVDVSNDALQSSGVVQSLISEGFIVETMRDYGSANHIKITVSW